jgi:ADP-heptose:LPS heptosyltransferase
MPTSGGPSSGAGRPANLGVGDQIMATGIARGASERGKRVAFGDGRRIIWDQHSRMIFASNPDIAYPGSETARDVEWVPFYRGHRLYNSQRDGRWIWNYDFHARPGRLVFAKTERLAGTRLGQGFVLIEPNVVRVKSSAVNKDWGRPRYQAVADALRLSGHRVVQFRYAAGPPLAGVETIVTTSFRDAAALLANAALYIGPEGGSHHAAAALGTPGVVIFGGFIPPQVTGYDLHTNLTGGAEACGSLHPCDHCRAALDAISVDDVIAAAAGHLKEPVR